MIPTLFTNCEVCVIFWGKEEKRIWSLINILNTHC